MRPASSSLLAAVDTSISAPRLDVRVHRQEQGDGTTQGQYQINNRDVGAKEHGVVTCLEVVGNEAWVGAVITASTNPNSLGFERVWRVVDRGEGSAAPPDQVSITIIGLGIAQTCHTAPVLPLEEIESGNIQVQDAR